MVELYLHSPTYLHGAVLKSIDNFTLQSAHTKFSVLLLKKNLLKLDHD
jgi:hypothetical protein